MFVTVLTYRARAGEEDAIVAPHEDWQRTRRDKAPGFLAGELLNAHGDAQAFIDVARFETEADAGPRRCGPKHRRRDQVTLIPISALFPTDRCE